MGSSPVYTVHFTDSSSRITPYTSYSRILRPDAYFDSLTHPHIVASSPRETYGSPSAPNVLRLGNGGLGPTGILRVLCDAYLAEKGLHDWKIEWICNHSRHTQIALAAGVVDLVLTYERPEEVIAVEEGWARDEGVLCHDHFVLAGPSSDPAGLGAGLGPEDLVDAFRKIAQTGSPFHTRGDGSATMHREIAIWTEAGYSQADRDSSSWFVRVAGTPHDAVRWANEHHTYLLVDRSTLLSAREAGEGLDLRVFVEGGERLNNSCVMAVRTEERRERVLDFVSWLKGEASRKIMREYGMDWELGVPMVSLDDELDFPLTQTIQAVLPLERSSGASTSLAKASLPKIPRPTFNEMRISSSVLPKELVL